MGNTHLITLEVKYSMDDMECSVDESGGIALLLIEEALGQALAGDVSVSVTCWEGDED